MVVPVLRLGNLLAMTDSDVETDHRPRRVRRATTSRSALPRQACSEPKTGQLTRRRVSETAPKSRRLSSHVEGSAEELLEWVNGLLDLDLRSLSDCRNGSVYCQLMDCLFPGKIRIEQVQFDRYDDDSCRANYRILQGALTNEEIHRELPVDELMAGMISYSLSLLQWCRMMFRRIYTGQPYDGPGRRSLAKRSQQEQRRRRSQRGPVEQQKSDSAIVVGSPEEFGQCRDGSIENALLHCPVDLIIVGQSLFIVEFGSHSIRQVELDQEGSPTEGGSMVRVVLGGTAFGVELACPLGITMLPDRTSFFIADSGSNTIRKFQPNSRTSSVVVSSGLFQPSCVLIDENNRLFIADRIGIHCVNGEGSRAEILIQADRPTSMKWLRPGVIAVCESNRHRIAQFDVISGTMSTLVGSTDSCGFKDGPALLSKLNCPQGICLDPDRNFLFITDLNHSIRRLDLQTMVVDTLRVPFSLDFPCGIFAAGRSTLYVADSANNCIRRITMRTNTNWPRHRTRRWTAPKSRTTTPLHSVGDPVVMCSEEIRRLASIARPAVLESVNHALCAVLGEQPNLFQTVDQVRRFLLQHDLPERLRRVSNKPMHAHHRDQAIKAASRLNHSTTKRIRKWIEQICH